AAANGGVVNVLGNQIAGLLNLVANQVGAQVGAGQIGALQLPVNLPIRVLSPGDDQSSQSAQARGTASNTGGQEESGGGGGAGDPHATNAKGNQIGDIANLTGNQLLGQVAGGQLVSAQAPVNAPVRVLSPGSDRSSQQT